MRSETAATILEYFAGANWAREDSKRHEAASQVLAECTHEEITQACTTMRQSISRSAIKPEELLGEIKRNRKKTSKATKFWESSIDGNEVERHRAEMRRDLLLAPREVVARGVAHCRKVQALDAQPLAPDISTWSNFEVGVVHAAISILEESNEARS
jgi:hypothetical protein